MSWDLSKGETPDAEAVARWKGLAWLLAKATAQQTSLPIISTLSETTSPASFRATQEQSDLLARRAAEHQFSNDFAQQLLRALAATDSEFVTSNETSRDVLFRRAQRLVLALDRLSNAIGQRTTAAAKNPALNQLFEDIRSRTDFQAPRFVEHLRGFGATIEPSLR
jgi:hypothetical protein